MATLRSVCNEGYTCIESTGITPSAEDTMKLDPLFFWSKCLVCWALTPVGGESVDPASTSSNAGKFLNDSSLESLYVTVIWKFMTKAEKIVEEVVKYTERE